MTSNEYKAATQKLIIINGAICNGLVRVLVVRVWVVPLIYLHKSLIEACHAVSFRAV